MERKDSMAKEKFGEGYEESKLGGKLHRAFMAEIGVEMCQAEVAHHANKCPEHLISREVKYVHLYKKALALAKTSADAKGPRACPDDRLGEYDPEAWWDGTQSKGPDPAEEKVGTKPSDVELYERRTRYSFWPSDTPISPHLPQLATPEEQVAAASLWDFFRLVRFRGGRRPYLEWHEPADCPIVVMSPVVKLTEGPDFAFGARWALMQYHTWVDRAHFLDMSDAAVKECFRDWRQSVDCPWYVKQQYLDENGRRARGGAGPTGKTSTKQDDTAVMEPEVYQAKITAFLDARDFAAAAALQLQQKHATGPTLHTMAAFCFRKFYTLLQSGRTVLHKALCGNNVTGQFTGQSTVELLRRAH